MARVKRMGVMSGGGASVDRRSRGPRLRHVPHGRAEHAHYYDALNASLNVIYGGHYTTETAGVQALGRHLHERFGVEFAFVDLPTGL